MAYSAKLNGITFFSTLNDSEKYLLSSAKLKKESGVSGTFTFTIPPCNQYYNSFHKLTDYVDVYRDDDIIFSGRVYSIKETFDTQLTIECESLIAILNDSIFRPQKFEDSTAREVFRSIIGNHNTQVENGKKINIGRITVDDNACYRDYQKIETTLKRINDLSESYEGRIEIRRESDGLYIDWLKAYTDGVDQIINFGENILDIEKKEDASSIITHLIPYGAKDSDGNLINIKSVNNNVDYVSASNEYINAYGHIWATKTWNDVTIPRNLKTKAQNYVNACCAQKVTIKVKAVDLADAGFNVDYFDTGQLIKVKSSYHGLDGGNSCWFECNKIDIDLLNPTSNKLELGATVKGYVQSKRNTTSEQQRAIEEIAETYLPKSDLDSAIEQATSLITGNDGGYVVVHDSDLDGYPDEILIMDTPNIETAVNVWRWNNSGLGYSSTGYDGSYGLAMTIDGEIVADYVTTGTMSADRIRAGILRAQQGDTYWNLNTGQFHFGSNYDTDKSKVFTYEPVTPYFIGDLWVTNRTQTTAVSGYAISGQAIAGVEGTVGEGGQILVCKNTRDSGDYVSSDWVLLTNYIDTEELESIKGRLSTAELNIVATNTLLDQKLDASYATSQEQVNVSVQQTLDLHARSIEQKASQETVSGLATTVSNVSGKFDASGSLIELKAYKEINDENVAEKSKVYRQTPTAPYSVGDLWVTTSVDSMGAFAGTAVAGRAIVGFGNDIYVAKVSRGDSATFNFSDWVKATDYVTQSQLEYTEKRINDAEIALDAANANIALKASQQVVNGLTDRMTEASIRIDAQEAQIESKVSQTDFTGQTVTSLINQSPDSVTIKANHININGVASLNDSFKVLPDGNVEVNGTYNYTYTSDDVNRIRDIIMAGSSGSEQELAKYDFDGSGFINTIDYIICKDCVENYRGNYQSMVKMIPDSFREMFVVSSSTGRKTSIGPGTISTDYINIGKGMYGDGKRLGYIIDYGTVNSGGYTWNYQKWHNGYYDCWLSLKKTNLAITTEWGSLYEGRIGAFTFPKTFTRTPNIQTSIYWGSEGWMLEARNDTATTTTTPTYFAVCPTSKTIDVGITISASGYIE